MENFFAYSTIFVIAFLYVLFIWFFFKFLNRTEKKLLEKYDKKTQFIIHGVIFLCIFWGLKWAGAH